MKYEPTFESVKKHPIPEWYDNAKFGIFFHWSLFSVPAYAENHGKSLAELDEGDGFATSLKNSPYAEWYLNSMRIEDSPTQKHHKEVYGKNVSYFDFQEEFEQVNESANMEEWADICKQAGAQYVVLVTKHHDGYCLWPSEYKIPGASERQSKRDFVGELTEAVRSRDMKMGLYYSGIYDWSYIDYPIKDFKTWVQHHLPTDEYCNYAVAQMYELIEKYKPSVLWNDIGFPPQYDVNKMFADYYNAVPEGVVCDRWKQYHLDQSRDKEEQIIELSEKLTENIKYGLEKVMENDNHCDFHTPEYVEKFTYRDKKWELTRGMGMSFGYNKEETEEDMLSFEDIVTTLVDVVSKNGNMLLNIGPMANGIIHDMQKNPLLRVGEWLKENGEAIFGTRCWDVQESTTTEGLEVRYTQKADALYVSILSETIPDAIIINDLEIPEDSDVSLLGSHKSVAWENHNGKLLIKVPEHKKQPVSIFKVYKTK